MFTEKNLKKSEAIVALVVGMVAIGTPVISLANYVSSIDARTKAAEVADIKIQSQVDKNKTQLDSLAMYTDRKVAQLSIGLTAVSQQIIDLSNGEQHRKNAWTEYEGSETIAKSYPPVLTDKAR